MNDNSQLEGTARIRFGITHKQWLVLEKLMSREAVSREALEVAVFGDDAGVAVRASLSQLIGILRDKLRPHGVTIQSLRQFGYFIPANERRKVSDILSQDA